MKFCQPHWDELRKAIADRGLSHLVAKSGEEAHAAMVESLTGGAPAYDPLMDAHWMITNRALEIAGLDLMVGDKCPLCEAEAGGLSEGRPGLASKWITGCTDSILRHCQEKGLVHPKQ